MWIFPTCGRPKQFHATLEQMKKMGLSTPGIVIIQGNQSEYAPETIEFPKDWGCIAFENNVGIAAALNYVFEKFPDESFYGFISDDEFPCTHGWDTELIDAAGSWNIAHGNDRWESDTRCHGFPTLGGDLVRAMNFIALPGLWCSQIDNFWEFVGAECGNGRFCRDVVIQHKHYLTGNSEYDETYKIGESKTEEDKQRYQEWLKTASVFIDHIRNNFPKTVCDLTDGWEEK